MDIMYERRAYQYKRRAKEKKRKNANHTYRQQADIHDSSTKPKRLNKKPTPLV
jgi:hypothetical protein